MTEIGDGLTKKDDASTSVGRICCVTSTSSSTTTTSRGRRMSSSRNSSRNTSRSSSRREDAPLNSNRNHNAPHKKRQNSLDIDHAAESFIDFIKSSLSIGRSRLQIDPPAKLFFMYEPGKQSSSVISIKNISSSRVAFKFQTNAPKSCFMRPPNGILEPKETLLASVVKFVEPSEVNHREILQIPTCHDKFKIFSLRVDDDSEYTQELFEENKSAMKEEGLLRVVFLDPKLPSKELGKLKGRLAEAESQKQKTKEENSNKHAAIQPPAIAQEGCVLDQWRQQRGKYLEKQNS